jgi:hypothetical protein
MLKKSLSLIIAGLFLLVSLSFIEAASLSISNIIIPSEISQEDESFQIVFDLENKGQATNLDWSSSIATSGTINEFLFSSNYIGSGNYSSPEVITITSTINIPKEQTEEISGIINAKVINGSGNDVNFTFSIPIEINSDIPEEIKECLLMNNINDNLRLKIDDVSVIYGFGDDDDYWYIFDEVEVEVEVENRENEKIRDIEIIWGLYNVDEEDWIIDEKENDFNLKDGDEKTVSVKFKLDDPKDFKDGGEYIFYVWAIGESEELNEDVCSYEFFEIDIIDDDDFVILNNIELSEETIECGSSFLITGNAWNIGDNDQDDVSIRIYNSELNLNQEIIIGDIDEFDKKSFSAEISIPENANEGNYALYLEVYDEDKDLYENDEDDESRFIIPIQVQGNCGYDEIPSAVISATLESGGNAGEELIIKLTVLNSGESSNIYTINAEGYIDWASLKEISPSSIHLNKGESSEVLLIFDIKEDASGDKNFDIKLLTDNKEILSQPVQVYIEESDNSFMKFFNDNQIVTILIGLIILILIIIIIVLITKNK